MATKKANLNFHQTFAPDADYLATLFDVAREETPYTKQEISDITGIPTGVSSGKVEPFIKYAEYMGLITDKYEKQTHLLGLTDLGYVVCDNDPYLQEKITLLLCHMNLVSSRGATLWNFVFCKLATRILKNVALEDGLKREFGENNPVKVLGAFRSSYKGMFKKLACVKEVPEGLKFSSISYRDENFFAYALVFFDEWDFNFGEVSEITENQINDLNLDKIMCLSKEEFNHFLDEMVSEGIVKIDRLLSPYVVIRLKSREYILEHLYSRLL